MRGYFAIISISMFLSLTINISRVPTSQSSLKIDSKLRTHISRHEIQIINGINSNINVSLHNL